MKNTDNFIRVIPLLSGSSGNCVFVDYNGVRILMDVGSESSGKKIPDLLYSQTQLTLRDIDYIFITHEHTDHVGGLSYVLNNIPKTAIKDEAGNPLAMPKLMMTEDTWHTFKNRDILGRDLSQIEKYLGDNPPIIISVPPPGASIEAFPIDKRIKDLDPSKKVSLYMASGKHDTAGHQTSFLVLGDVSRADFVAGKKPANVIALTTDIGGNYDKVVDDIANYGIPTMFAGESNNIVATSMFQKDPDLARRNISKDGHASLNDFEQAIKRILSMDKEKKLKVVSFAHGGHGITFDAISPTIKRILYEHGREDVKWFIHNIDGPSEETIIIPTEVGSNVVVTRGKALDPLELEYLKKAPRGSEDIKGMRPIKRFLFEINSQIPDRKEQEKVLATAHRINAIQALIKGEDVGADTWNVVHSYIQAEELAGRPTTMANVVDMLNKRRIDILSTLEDDKGRRIPKPFEDYSLAKRKAIFLFNDEDGNGLPFDQYRGNVVAVQLIPKAENPDVMERSHLYLEDIDSKHIYTIPSKSKGVKYNAFKSGQEIIDESLDAMVKHLEKFQQRYIDDSAEAINITVKQSELKKLLDAVLEERARRAVGIKEELGSATSSSDIALRSLLSSDTATVDNLSKALSEMRTLWSKVDGLSEEEASSVEGKSLSTIKNRSEQMEKSRAWLKWYLRKFKGTSSKVTVSNMIVKMLDKQLDKEVILPYYKEINPYIRKIVKIFDNIQENDYTRHGMVLKRYDDATKLYNILNQIEQSQSDPNKTEEIKKLNKELHYYFGKIKENHINDKKALMELLFHITGEYSNVPSTGGSGELALRKVHETINKIKSEQNIQFPSDSTTDFGKLLGYLDTAIVDKKVDTSGIRLLRTHLKRLSDENHSLLDIDDIFIGSKLNNKNIPDKKTTINLLKKTATYGRAVNTSVQDSERNLREGYYKRYSKEHHLSIPSIEDLKRQLDNMPAEEVINKDTNIISKYRNIAKRRFIEAEYRKRYTEKIKGESSFTTKGDDRTTLDAINIAIEENQNIRTIAEEDLSNKRNRLKQLIKLSLQSEMVPVEERVGKKVHVQWVKKYGLGHGKIDYKAIEIEANNIMSGLMNQSKATISMQLKKVIEDVGETRRKKWEALCDMHDLPELKGLANYTVSLTDKAGDRIKIRKDDVGKVYVTNYGKYNGLVDVKKLKKIRVANRSAHDLLQDIIQERHELDNIDTIINGYISAQERGQIAERKYDGLITLRSEILQGKIKQKEDIGVELDQIDSISREVSINDGLRESMEHYAMKREAIKRRKDKATGLLEKYNELEKDIADIRSDTSINQSLRNSLVEDSRSILVELFDTVTEDYARRDELRHFIMYNGGGNQLSNIKNTCIKFLGDINDQLVFLDGLNKSTVGYLNRGYQSVPHMIESVKLTQPHKASMAGSYIVTIIRDPKEFGRLKSIMWRVPIEWDYSASAYQQGLHYQLMKNYGIPWTPTDENIIMSGVLVPEESIFATEKTPRLNYRLTAIGVNPTSELSRGSILERKQLMSRIVEQIESAATYNIHRDKDIPSEVDDLFKIWSDGIEKINSGHVAIIEEGRAQIKNVKAQLRHINGVEYINNFNFGTMEDLFKDLVNGSIDEKTGTVKFLSPAEQKWVTDKIVSIWKRMDKNEKAAAVRLSLNYKAEMMYKTKTHPALANIKGVPSPGSFAESMTKAIENINILTNQLTTMYDRGYENNTSITHIYKDIYGTDKNLGRKIIIEVPESLQDIFIDQTFMSGINYNKVFNNAQKFDANIQMVNGFAEGEPGVNKLLTIESIPVFSRPVDVGKVEIHDMNRHIYTSIIMDLHGKIIKSNIIANNAELIQLWSENEELVESIENMHSRGSRLLDRIISQHDANNINVSKFNETMRKMLGYNNPTHLDMKEHVGYGKFPLLVWVEDTGIDHDSGLPNLGRVHFTHIPEQQYIDQMIYDNKAWRPPGSRMSMILQEYKFGEQYRIICPNGLDEVGLTSEQKQIIERDLSNVVYDIDRLLQHTPSTNTRVDKHIMYDKYAVAKPSKVLHIERHTTLPKELSFGNDTKFVYSQEAAKAIKQRNDIQYFSILFDKNYADIGVLSGVRDDGLPGIIDSLKDVKKKRQETLNRLLGKKAPKHVVDRIKNEIIDINERIVSQEHKLSVSIEEAAKAGRKLLDIAGIAFDSKLTDTEIISTVGKETARALVNKPLNELNNIIYKANQLITSEEIGDPDWIKTFRAATLNMKNGPMGMNLVAPIVTELKDGQKIHLALSMPARMAERKFISDINDKIQAFESINKVIVDRLRADIESLRVYPVKNKKQIEEILNRLEKVKISRVGHLDDVVPNINAMISSMNELKPSDVVVSIRRWWDRQIDELLPLREQIKELAKPEHMATYDQLQAKRSLLNKKIKKIEKDTYADISIIVDLQQRATKARDEYNILNKKTVLTADEEKLLGVLYEEARATEKLLAFNRTITRWSAYSIFDRFNKRLTNAFTDMVVGTMHDLLYEIPPNQLLKFGKPNVDWFANGVIDAVIDRLNNFNGTYKFNRSELRELLKHKVLITDQTGTEFRGKKLYQLLVDTTDRPSSALKKIISNHIQYVYATKFSGEDFIANIPFISESTHRIKLNNEINILNRQLEIPRKKLEGKIRALPAIEEKYRNKIVKKHVVDRLKSDISELTKQIENIESQLDVFRLTIDTLDKIISDPARKIKVGQEYIDQVKTTIVEERRKIAAEIMKMSKRRRQYSFPNREFLEAGTSVAGRVLMSAAPRVFPDPEKAQRFNKTVLEMLDAFGIGIRRQNLLSTTANLVFNEDPFRSGMWRAFNMTRIPKMQNWITQKLFVEPLRALDGLMLDVGIVHSVLGEFLYTSEAADPTTALRKVFEDVFSGKFKFKIPNQYLVDAYVNKYVKSDILRDELRKNQVEYQKLLSKKQSIKSKIESINKFGGVDAQLADLVRELRDVDHKLSITDYGLSGIKRRELHTPSSEIFRRVDLRHPKTGEVGSLHVSYEYVMELIPGRWDSKKGEYGAENAEGKWIRTMEVRWKDDSAVYEHRADLQTGREILEKNSITLGLGPRKAPDTFVGMVRNFLDDFAIPDMDAHNNTVELQKALSLFVKQKEKYTNKYKINRASITKEELEALDSSANEVLRLMTNLQMLKNGLDIDKDILGMEQLKHKYKIRSYDEMRTLYEIRMALSDAILSKHNGRDRFLAKTVISEPDIYNIARMLPAGVYSGIGMTIDKLWESVLDLTALTQVKSFGDGTGVERVHNISYKSINADATRLSKYIDHDRALYNVIMDRMRDLIESMIDTNRTRIDVRIGNGDSIIDHSSHISDGIVDKWNKLLESRNAGKNTKVYRDSLKDFVFYFRSHHLKTHFGDDLSIISQNDKNLLLQDLLIGMSSRFTSVEHNINKLVDKLSYEDLITDAYKLISNDVEASLKKGAASSSIITYYLNKTFSDGFKKDELVDTLIETHNVNARLNTKLNSIKSIDQITSDLTKLASESVSKLKVFNTINPITNKSTIRQVADDIIKWRKQLFGYVEDGVNYDGLFQIKNTLEEAVESTSKKLQEANLNLYAKQKVINRIGGEIDFKYAPIINELTQNLSEVEETIGNIRNIQYKIELAETVDISKLLSNEKTRHKNLLIRRDELIKQVSKAKGEIPEINDFLRLFNEIISLENTLSNPTGITKVSHLGMKITGTGYNDVLNWVNHEIANIAKNIDRNKPSIIKYGDVTLISEVFPSYLYQLKELGVDDPVSYIANNSYDGNINKIAVSLKEIGITKGILQGKIDEMNRNKKEKLGDIDLTIKDLSKKLMEIRGQVIANQDTHSMVDITSDSTNKLYKKYTSTGNKKLINEFKKVANYEDLIYNQFPSWYVPGMDDKDFVKLLRISPDIRGWIIDLLIKNDGTRTYSTKVADKFLLRAYRIMIDDDINNVVNLLKNYRILTKSKDDGNTILAKRMIEYANEENIAGRFHQKLSTIDIANLKTGDEIDSKKLNKLFDIVQTHMIDQLSEANHSAQVNAINTIELSNLRHNLSITVDVKDRKSIEEAIIAKRLEIKDGQDKVNAHIKKFKLMFKDVEVGEFVNNHMIYTAASETAEREIMGELRKKKVIYKMAPIDTKRFERVYAGLINNEINFINTAPDDKIIKLMAKTIQRRKIKPEKFVEIIKEADENELRRLVIEHLYNKYYVPGYENEIISEDIYVIEYKLVKGKIHKSVLLVNPMIDVDLKKTLPEKMLDAYISRKVAAWKLRNPDKTMSTKDLRFIEREAATEALESRLISLEREKGINETSLKAKIIGQEWFNQEHVENDFTDMLRPNITVSHDGEVKATRWLGETDQVVKQQYLAVRSKLRFIQDQLNDARDLKAQIENGLAIQYGDNLYGGIYAILSKQAMFDQLSNNERTIINTITSADISKSDILRAMHAVELEYTARGLAIPDNLEEFAANRALEERRARALLDLERRNTAEQLSTNNNKIEQLKNDISLAQNLVRNEMIGSVGRTIKSVVQAYELGQRYLGEVLNKKVDMIGMYVNTFVNNNWDDLRTSLKAFAAARHLASDIRQIWRGKIPNGWNMDQFLLRYTEDWRAATRGSLKRSIQNHIIKSIDIGIDSAKRVKPHATLLSDSLSLSVDVDSLDEAIARSMEADLPFIKIRGKTRKEYIDNVQLNLDDDMNTFVNRIHKDILSGKVFIPSKIRAVTGVPGGVAGAFAGPVGVGEYKPDAMNIDDYMDAARKDLFGKVSKRFNNSMKYIPEAFSLNVANQAIVSLVKSNEFKGICQGVEWITMDKGVCRRCKGNDGKRWTINYVDKHGILRTIEHPKNLEEPQLHPGCRCFLVPFMFGEEHLRAIGVDLENQRVKLINNLRKKRDFDDQSATSSMPIDFGEREEWANAYERPITRNKLFDIIKLPEEEQRKLLGDKYLLWKKGFFDGYDKDDHAELHRGIEGNVVGHVLRDTVKTTAKNTMKSILWKFSDDLRERVVAGDNTVFNPISLVQMFGNATTSTLHGEEMPKILSRSVDQTTNGAVNNANTLIKYYKMKKNKPRIDEMSKRFIDDPSADPNEVFEDMVDEGFFTDDQKEDFDDILRNITDESMDLEQSKHEANNEVSQKQADKYKRSMFDMIWDIGKGIFKAFLEPTMLDVAFVAWGDFRPLEKPIREMATSAIAGFEAQDSRGIEAISKIIKDAVESGDDVEKLMSELGDDIITKWLDTEDGKRWEKFIQEKHRQSLNTPKSDVAEDIALMVQEQLKDIARDNVLAASAEKGLDASTSIEDIYKEPDMKRFWLTVDDDTRSQLWNDIKTNKTSKYNINEFIDQLDEWDVGIPPTKEYESISKGGVFDMGDEVNSIEAFNDNTKYHVVVTPEGRMIRSKQPFGSEMMMERLAQLEDKEDIENYVGGEMWREGDNVLFKAARGLEVDEVDNVYSTFENVGFGPRLEDRLVKSDQYDNIGEGKVVNLGKGFVRSGYDESAIDDAYSRKVNMARKMVDTLSDDLMETNPEFEKATVDERLRMLRGSFDDVYGLSTGKPSKEFKGQNFWTLFDTVPDREGNTLDIIHKKNGTRLGYDQLVDYMWGNKDQPGTIMRYSRGEMLWKSVL